MLNYSSIEGGLVDNTLYLEFGQKTRPKKAMEWLWYDSVIEIYSKSLKCRFIDLAFLNLNE